MIYYVEDDDNIRELVVYTLNQVGLEARGYSCARDFYGAMEQQAPDLVLLDIMLPEEDGLTILRRLRAEAATEEIPVVMITAKGTEFDKVKGLDWGADDYIAKPFGMLEMVARIKAVLRRYEGPSLPQNGQLITRDNLTVNLLERKVSVGEEEVLLTLKEFELLKKFLLYPGIVFSRDKLLNDIWGYEFTGETRTVDVHIRTLRQKLGSAGDLVETIRGVGYRMAATK